MSCSMRSKHSTVDIMRQASASVEAMQGRKWQQVGAGQGQHLPAARVIAITHNSAKSPQPQPACPHPLLTECCNESSR